jgi:hypothetical protein
MKKLLIPLMMIFATEAVAESTSLGLQMPSAPSSYGQDSIRSGDLDCKNAIGGATQLEFGVTGIIDNADTPFSGSYGNQSKDIGVFARIVIPLDKPRERINCNSLYQLELRKKRLEVLRLQEELEALRRLNSQQSNSFEN